MLNSYVLEFQNVVRPPFDFLKFGLVENSGVLSHLCQFPFIFQLQNVDSLISKTMFFKGNFGVNDLL